ncbi:leucine-rich repeat domain-containing protein [Streptacidiphilus monticola]
MSELWLDGQDLTVIAPQLLGPELTVLSAYRNRLTQFPAALPSGLRVLNLADNLIGQVPETLGRLRQLHTLDLGHNRISALPDAIGDLHGLSRYLYLSDNRLTELPAALTRLSRLGYLGATDNRLASFLPTSAPWPRCTSCACTATA